MKMFPVQAFLIFACCFQSAGQGGATDNAERYYCPPCNNSCDTIAFDKPGICKYCGMTLIKKTSAEKNKMDQTKKIKICFYLQNGVEVLDFAGPMEAFAYAGFEVFTVSKTKEPILSQGILKIIPDYSIQDAPDADIMVFFGGNSGVAANDPDIISWISKREGQTKYFLSVCSGAFILGKSGLLNGLSVTTFHTRIKELQDAVPLATVLSNVRFVDNGRIITTAGVSAGIDGALHLIAKLLGDQAAKQTALYMEYDKWNPADGLIMPVKK